MENKKSIYFLCTGNSCRSQMAEGFARKYLGYTHEILSAGIEPKGINPIAVKVMNEIGIDISNQTSDYVNVKLLNQVDIVITLCKDAQERCPVVIPRAAHFHWPFDDPAKAKGTEEEILETYRIVRDEIESAILKFKQGFTGEAFNTKNSSIENLTLKEDFGERIQNIRKTKGFTIKELAEKIQVSEDFLLKTEQNKTEPSKYFIHSLSTTFDIDYEDLLENLYYVKTDAIS